jgi:hypothetical protein
MVCSAQQTKYLEMYRIKPIEFLEFQPLTRPYPSDPYPPDVGIRIRIRILAFYLKNACKIQIFSKNLLFKTEDTVPVGKL